MQKCLAWKNKAHFIEAMKSCEELLFEHEDVYIFRQGSDYYSINLYKKRALKHFCAKNEVIIVTLDFPQSVEPVEGGHHNA